jgi:hypothetical protein
VVRQEQPVEETSSYKVPLLSDDDDDSDEDFNTGRNDAPSIKENFNPVKDPHINDSVNKNINYNNNNNENNRPFNSYGASTQNSYGANTQNSYGANTQNSYGANTQNSYQANVQSPVRPVPAVDSYGPVREPEPVAVNPEIRHVPQAPAPNTYIINANLGEKKESNERVNPSPAKEYVNPAPIPDARFNYANANPAPDTRYSGPKQNDEVRYNYNNYIPADNNYGKNSYSAQDNGSMSGVELARKEEELRIQWQILMKERFKLDYEKMIQANIANLPNASTMTPEQKANLASQMGPNIRQMLININLDYQKLAKEGII